MLELRNIKKDYVTDNETVTALRSVSLAFRQNEFVSILGVSGCGKTTMLNIIGGLDRYTDGDLLINGRSTKEYKSSDWDFYRNKTIGFVFQSYNLIAHLTVLKNVEMALTLAGVSKADRKQRAIEALSKVGLEKHINKRPNQLSGGQMQRVAIARALINNPEIILADEPTGALDSESGVQVMELLKTVARDRLVIMVTHNADLAKKYSTRIISLSDGAVIGDTDPYEAEPPVIINSDKSKYKRIKKKKGQNKVSMSLLTAISLSFHNLWSKKGRTFLTSFAGSIGIIGIALILSLSVGVSNFISSSEKSSLSLYPVMVGQTNFDVSSLTSFVSLDTGTGNKYPDSDEITTRKVFGDLLSNLTSFVSQNDLTAAKQYLDEGFSEDWGYIKYDYSTQFNIYCNHNNDTKYTKVNPFMDSLQDDFKTLIQDFEDYLSMITLWDQLLDNQSVLSEQYELLGSSRWPTAKDEIIVVVDEYNMLNDYALFSLGLVTAKDLVAAMLGSEIALDKTFTVNELLGLEYRVLTNADYYDYDNTNEKWLQNSITRSDKEFVDSNGIGLKVVGVVRPKKGASAASIVGVLGYTKLLTEYMVQSANANPAVIAQKANPTNNIVTGARLNETQYETLMESMGVANLDKPYSIRIYANSFAKKDAITTYLDAYESEKGKKLTYTDTLGLLMSYIGIITNTVTYVLIGFSAISLVVSSIMIAIITYTSVLERRKEIGVLRSIGAKKNDISTVFLAESSMIGLSSGVFGIIITLLIAIPANLILKAVLNVAGLVSVVWWHALILIALSVILSMIAGFVPARIAANRDPVAALRT